MEKTRIDFTNMGNLVHRSSYGFIVECDNDRNNHLNNAFYDNYSEKVRQDFFLPFYGWSDNWFNERDLQQSRTESGIFFKKGIGNGEKMKVNLELFIKNKIWFHMKFDFVRPDDNLAARMYSADHFNQKRNGVWLPCKIPQFFIDEIKNVGD